MPRYNLSNFNLLILIMIPFRSTLRNAFLSVLGPFKSISPSIHILNGHVIGESPTQGQAKFRQLVRELSRNAHLIRIEEACEWIRLGKPVTQPVIAFTFDDGYIDCYQDIAPVLEEFGTNALFFINPNFTRGDPAYIDHFLRTRVPDIARRPPMTPRMVRDLAQRGFVIGAHTLDHVKLTETDPEILEQQIGNCKSAVESISEQACDTFAWTYGRYVDISDAALALACRHYPLVFSGDQYEQYTSRQGRVFNRRHFECDWPVSHLNYFLSTARQYEAEVAYVDGVHAEGEAHP